MKLEARRNARAYLVFEGGGAKGIGHIGAARAALQEFSVQGFAGSSAGAIVATLLAAGYEPDELVDLSGNSALLKALGVARPSQLMPGWSGVEKIIKQIGKRGSIVDAACYAALFFMACYRGNRQHAHLGLFSPSLLGLENFEEELRCLLSKKIFGVAGEIVRFSHFDGRSRSSILKVVATDFVDGRTFLFSPETTPNVSVSEAVAASASIPGIFPPVYINLGDVGAKPFYDGGLTSNLPMWAFASELAIDRDARIVAVRIGGEAQNAPQTFWSWFRHAARVAVFGSGELNMRGMRNLIEVSLPSDGIDLLEFDAKKEKILPYIEDCQGAMQTAINGDADIDALADNIRISFTSLFGGQRIRVALVPLTSSDIGLHPSIVLPLRHCAGFEESPDEFLDLPARTSLAGSAASSRTPTLEHFSTLDDAVRRFTEEQRFPRKLVKMGGAKWVFAAPLSIVLSKTQERTYLVLVDGDGEFPQLAAEELLEQIQRLATWEDGNGDEGQLGSG